MMPSPASDQPSTIAAMRDAFAAAKAAAAQSPFPHAGERRDRLLNMAGTISERTDDLITAIERDFGCRQKHETLFMEIFVTVSALRHAAKNVASWMAPRRRRVPWELGLGKAWVQPQPLGVVGVIAPWNYPFYLAMGPVVDALAAGNQVLVKPSEFTPHVSTVIDEIVADSGLAGYVRVINGNAEVAQAFSTLPFDHLVFTGSGRVGQMVMRAASENLTPVTLELGGKSPALILPDADMAQAARDVTFGKFTNCGQTCVAPDYALVHEDQREAFLGYLAVATKAYFGGTGTKPDLTSIFGAEGRRRQEMLMAEARNAGVRIVSLVDMPLADMSFAPCAVIDPPATLRLSTEEIFGPILPVLSYRTVDAALEHVRNNPRPLAFYLFGRDKARIDLAVRSVVAGGMVINDTLVHVGIKDLPFGGVGGSGMGSYHGRDGFDRLSHLKAVFHRHGPRIDTMIRPPFRAWQERIARFLINR